MLEWLADNKQWLFSGVGVTVLLLVGGYLRSRVRARVIRVPHGNRHDVRSTVLIDARRDEAYTRLSAVVSAKPESHIDMLQFTGWAAINLLKSIGRSCRGASVRLLVVADSVADEFDGAGFHQRNIQATVNALKVLELDHPDMTFSVWRYKTMAVVSGVILGTSSVTAGWYHVFTGYSGRPCLRSHSEPIVTSLDNSVPSLHEFVRKQFDASLYSPSTEFDFAFGPQAESSLMSELPKYSLGYPRPNSGRRS